VFASIIIPTYNQRPDWLSAALGSALAQTVGCEVIVVDDGSETPVLTDVANVTVIRHGQNRGVSAALNTGIRAMSGEVFCWLPSDDLFAPRKVEVQFQTLRESGRKASFHQYYTFKDDATKPDSLSGEWDWSSHRRQRRQLGVGCAVNGLTVMLHRDVFDKVGVFDESYHYGQDWEFWCRVTREFEWLPMLDVLAYRRESGANLTAVIAGDEERKRVRDGEDERIRAQYGAA